jgi:uncharacterized protein
MRPELNQGVYVFSSVPLGTDIGNFPVIATFREKEGLTLIVEETIARREGLPILFSAAWITLTVHSDLQAVGLTAAFSSALGAEGIGCNVLAAAFHDHLFVPVDRAEKAMDVLKRLQESAQVGHAAEG